MYKHMFTSACVYGCLSTCVHMHVEIEVDIRCHTRCSLSYVLRQDLALNLELMDTARFTGQQAQPLPHSDASLKIIVTCHPD